MIGAFTATFKGLDYLLRTEAFPHHQIEKQIDTRSDKLLNSVSTPLVFRVGFER
jgi:hypothetical protein